jgi:hypothetical protein
MLNLSGPGYVDSFIGIASRLSLTGVQPCCHFFRFTLSQPNAVTDCALNFWPCLSAMPDQMLVSLPSSKLREQSP